MCILSTWCWIGIVGGEMCPLDPWEEANFSQPRICWVLQLIIFHLWSDDDQKKARAITGHAKDIDAKIKLWFWCWPCWSFELMAEKSLLMLVALEIILRVNVEKLQVKCMQLNLALVLGGCQLLQQQWKQTEGDEDHSLNHNIWDPHSITSTFTMSAPVH